MTAREVRDALYKRLKPLGAIKWHNNRSSYYIKFKDNRVGSIRISDHEGRERYSYTWQVNISEDTKFKLKEIIHEVGEKTKTIIGFDPEKYVVWKDGEYKEVATYKEYEEAILRKKGK